MHNYLLLRDNKQSGPYTLESLKELGLKPYDLIWVEGKSAAWRYASEIEECKSFAPGVEEQPFDRFFNRTKEEKKSQDVKIHSNNTDIPVRESRDEIKVPVLKENNAVPDNQEANAGNTRSREYHRPKYVSVSLPANPPKVNSSESHDAVPQAKSILPDEKQDRNSGNREQNHQGKPEVTKEKLISPKAVTFKPDVAEEIHMSSTKAVTTVSAGMSAGEGQIPEQISREIPQPARKGRKFSAFLQVAGMSLALVSLVGLGILIGLEIANKKAALSAVQFQSAVNPEPSNTVNEPDVIPAGTGQNDAKPLVNAQPAPANQESSTPELQKKKTSGTNKSRVEDKKAEPVEQIVAVKEPAPVSPAPDPEKEAAKTRIATQVSVSENKYKVGMFGGIENLQLTVDNSSSYPVDLVVVEVSYLQSNKKTYKTETLRFRDLAPHSTQTLNAPNTNRGIRVESRVTYLVSKALDVAQNF